MHLQDIERSSVNDVNSWTDSRVHQCMGMHHAV